MFAALIPIPLIFSRKNLFLISNVLRRRLNFLCFSSVYAHTHASRQRCALILWAHLLTLYLLFEFILTTPQGTASTLTKSEVRGGGKKPYKQKGTGNARQGSKRSPLLPGGGITFGPKPKDWSIKMNKKERRLAMATAIQSAASSMVVVDDINSGVTVLKSKAFQDNLKSWGVNVDDEKTYVITKDAPKEVELATRNMARVVHADITKLNVYDVLNADKVVVDEAALGYLNEFYGASGGAWA